MELKLQKFGKVTDPVKAVQYTGGPENGHAIMEWVRENDRGALWYEARPEWPSSDGKNGIPAVDEYISLRTPRGLKDVKIGEWIYIDDKGDFRSMTDEDFKKNYVKV